MTSQQLRKLRRLIREALAGGCEYIYENVDKLEDGQIIHNLTISWVTQEAPDVAE